MSSFSLLHTWKRCLQKVASTVSSPGRLNKSEASSPKFTRVLAFPSDPFCIRALCFGFTWVQTWHLSENTNKRLSILGITYLGMINVENFVEPRWVAWWRLVTRALLIVTGRMIFPSGVFLQLAGLSCPFFSSYISYFLYLTLSLRKHWVMLCRQNITSPHCQVSVPVTSYPRGIILLMSSEVEDSNL